VFKNRSFLVKLVKDTPSGTEEEEVSSDDILSHFERHKIAYSFAVGVMIAGITTLIMRSKPRPMWRGVEPMPNVGFANTASRSFVFRSPQTINVASVLDREGRGHPGWPVQNLETKQVFFSQKQAANAFNIGEGTLSSHLKGKFPDADGLHFNRVNLVSVSQEKHTM
jgi:hypothetical protein